MQRTIFTQELLNNYRHQSLRHHLFFPPRSEVYMVILLNVFCPEVCIISLRNYNVGYVLNVGPVLPSEISASFFQAWRTTSNLKLYKGDQFPDESWQQLQSSTIPDEKGSQASQVPHPLWQIHQLREKL